MSGAALALAQPPSTEPTLLQRTRILLVKRAQHLRYTVRRFAELRDGKVLYYKTLTAKQLQGYYNLYQSVIVVALPPVEGSPLPRCLQVFTSTSDKHFFLLPEHEKDLQELLAYCKSASNGELESAPNATYMLSEGRSKCGGRQRGALAELRSERSQEMRSVLLNSRSPERSSNRILSQGKLRNMLFEIDDKTSPTRPHTK